MNCPELERLLFHGSTVEIRMVDVSAGAKKKDFGQGFYMTSSKAQAEKFAKLKAKQRSLAYGHVSVFEYAHSPQLKIHRFEKADLPWLEYVIQNREPNSGGGEPIHEKYDIVIGPVADDAVGIVVNNLLAGVYGDKNTVEAKNLAIRFLEAENLHNQVFFGTKRGANCLRFKEAYKVAIDR